MKKTEATGRTLEEAIQLASHELGVPEDAIEYEILEEGTKGFFGMGQSPTLINAWVSGNYSGTVSVSSECIELPQTVMGLLEAIIDAMSMTVDLNVVNDNEEEIEIDITGDDVALLIGRQGATLDALQYLVSIAMSRDDASRRIVIDAGGYKRKHIETLQDLARKYAEGVKERGQEAELEPQSARDRRIIHMTLADDPDVYTYSEGMGPDRHVVISPK